MNTVRAPIIGAALLALACATAAQQAWQPPAAGTRWKVAEHNTGSYGSDVEYEVSRADTTWNGSPAVLFTKSTGSKIVATSDDGRWYAVLGPDDKPVLTFDPPIGSDMPPRPGATSSRTHTITGPGWTTRFPYTCTVGAVEKLTVRAGTFDAYRIDCNSGGSIDTYWMSAELGLTVKTDLTRVMPEAGRQQAELVEAPH